MDDIVAQLSRMTVNAQTTKKTKRKVSANAMEGIDAQPQPFVERRVLRATRSRAARVGNTETARFDLPLENTPSIVSDLEGKDVIHNMKIAIKMHRDIRVQLPSMKDAVLSVPGLFLDNRVTAAEKIMRENMTAFNKLEKMYESIMYVHDLIMPLRELVESKAVNTVNVDTKMRLTKLRSYLLKHNQECQKVYEDAVTYFGVISSVYSKRASMLEEARERVQKDKELEKSKKRFKFDMDATLELMSAFSVK